MKRLGCLARSGLVLLCLAGPLQAESSPQDLAKASIRELDLQTDMPDGAIKTPDPPKNSFSLPGSSETFRGLLWVAVVGGVLVLGYFLRDSLPLYDRSRRIVARDDGVHPASQPGAMNVAQTEADELARLGRYVEAMHVLLLQSLAEMRRRLGISIADSLTSREILRRVELPEIGRASLGAIIQQVERTYFGQQGADQADYNTCNDSFNALKQALLTRPAR